jgi:ABC-type branched-subunit amino acid transport system substrate-binding protein
VALQHAERGRSRVRARVPDHQARHLRNRPAGPRPGALLGLAALLVATTACGARWSDAQRTTVVDRYRPANATSAQAGTGSALNPEAATATAGPTAGTAPLTGSGAATSRQGSALTPAGGGSGAAPCAAPSTAPGVTPSEIRVGAISSVSGPVPGLGASAAAAARAYVAYRNATGGVCGRKITLTEGDDGTEGSRYRTLVTDMSSSVLGIAGGFSVGDVGGIDVIDQAKLPVVTNPSDKHEDTVASMFDINPPFPNPDAVIGKYRYLYDQGVRTATAVYIAVSQSRAEAQRQERLMKAAGIRVVSVQELPLSTLSFDSAARGVANSGADYLFFIGDANANGSMARSMADTGYHPKVSEYLTFAYGAGFIQLAGPAAAEGASSWIRTLPNEEASTNPEMAAFLEWMGRTAPGVDQDVFAADSWAEAKAFFDSLQALPGPITRAGLVSQLHSVGTYDAGGMLGPIRLGAKLTNGCVIGMQVRGGAWKRMTPATGFLC